MRVIQKEFSLKPRLRGFHIVTDEVISNLPELSKIQAGLAHIFIKHTSASLSINENADPSVRTDMETHFNMMVPEDANYYEHTLEGPDDMTSHIKASILGSGITIPITKGRLNMGTWQGFTFASTGTTAGAEKLL